MKGLIAKKHAVAFLGSCPVLLQMCREEGIPCVELQIGPPPVTKWGSISFMWRAKKMKRQLIQTFGQFQKLDAVFMLSLSEKLLLTEHAAASDTKVFWIEHDHIGRWLTKNPWLGDLRKVSGCATTITVSDLSRKMYVDLGWDAAKMMAIPNGVSVEASKAVNEWSANNHPLSAPGPRLHLGCVARLSKEKGIDVLIQAVNDLPEVTLDIVGTGKEEKNLQSLIKDHQQIHMHAKAATIGSFYQSLDALVLPSREHDPFGMAAAEAMMLGIPVIVTDACGIAGYSTDGQDALIVEKNSIPALREAIIRMKNPDLRSKIAENGKEKAQKLFSLKRMIDHYERLIV